MKIPAACGLVLAVTSLSCTAPREEPGSVRSDTVSIDGGKVEMVRADIQMDAGELRIESGAAGLLDAAFRYSERLGKPVVRYDTTGFRGRLTVAPAGRVGIGESTNEWTLRFGDKWPLDLQVRLGAGSSKLNLSRVPLRSVEVQMGAGELELDLRGTYPRNVTVDVKGGVGEAKILVLNSASVSADVKGGIGSVEAKGVVKRGDRYFSEGYDQSKPSLQLQVRGGVGAVHLIAE